MWTRGTAGKATAIPTSLCFWLQGLGANGIRLTMESALTARDRVGVQDFVLLENFTSEAAFIENLRKRFKENLIYVSGTGTVTTVSLSDLQRVCCTGQTQLCSAVGFGDVAGSSHRPWVLLSGAAWGAVIFWVYRLSAVPLLRSGGTDSTENPNSHHILPSPEFTHFHQPHS